VALTPAADPSGVVAGFADATGHFLPLVCTLNAARVLDAAAQLLGVDHAALSHLALSAPAGADGLVVVPYLEGERTPNRPDATGAVHGLRFATATPAHLARAVVEGLLCGLADGLDALAAHGALVDRVLLIGGGARSEAVRRIAPRCSVVPSSLRRPVSTWPRVRLGRRPGCLMAVTCRRSGAGPGPTSMRPTRYRRCANATPRSDSSPRCVRSLSGTADRRPAQPGRRRPVVAEKACNSPSRTARRTWSPLRGGFFGLTRATIPAPSAPCTLSATSRSTREP